MGAAGSAGLTTWGALGVSRLPWRTPGRHTCSRRWLSGGVRNSPAPPDVGLSPVCPALGYTVSSFSNGFLGCPGEGPRFSAPRRPSTSSLRHPSLGEESTRALIAPDEQVRKQLSCPSPLLWAGGGG